MDCFASLAMTDGVYLKATRSNKSMGLRRRQGRAGKEKGSKGKEKEMFFFPLFLARSSIPKGKAKKA
jgi:hypothetical protein